MKKSIKLSLVMATGLVLTTGCAQKVRIKALNPAEVGAMASKKKVAVTSFRNDRVGLSGKIEAELSRQRLNGKRYFTVLNRRDLKKIMAEQKLQSSEMMDASTATEVGKGIGAQAIITGEVASANAESSRYQENRKECVAYYKDTGECARYHYYKVTCNVTKASVSANISIVDVENSSVIYGDTFTKNYSGNTCKSGGVLSKSQALNRLSSNIASEFVYKLTPNYIYFNVALLDSIELENVTDKQKEQFASALEYIKAARYDKAKKIFQKLMDAFDGKSYAVAYDYGVVYEATGNFDKAKELYTIADEDATKPIDEINEAMIRIDKLIAKREEAKRQMNAK